MSAPPRDRRDRRGPNRLPETDRRASESGLAGWWRRLKGNLKRPLRLERRGLQWHLVLVDRRRSAEPFKPGSEVQLIAELRARLLALDEGHAEAGMRQLVHVHDELRRNGWRGVEGLASRDLARALAQAELLSSQGHSRSMALLIEKLRILKAGAELREEREAAQRRAAQEEAHHEAHADAVEVCETGFDEFHDTERDQVDSR